MPAWPLYPTLYEINTWVWLEELSRKAERPVDLGSVPATEWDAIAACGFDAIWFMGVWERSPAGIAIANRDPAQLQSFRQALPDFRSEDNVGSAYCIRSYVVDGHLGGPKGLATARRELAQRGMKLLLDFVPNHVAPDHPWTSEHPEYFIRGTAEDAQNSPGSYIEVQGNFIACGRDPYFPPWRDVLQLNAFATGLRAAASSTVSAIADQCDGVRCDMAMLLLNSIFQRTWGAKAGQPPATEYWDDLIGSLRSSHPGFLFIAEAYWDLEWELQQRGFDFCYDKRLYDRLEHDSPEAVRSHLCADLAYQQKLLRFLENHDEPRAAAAFPGPKEKAAAVVTSTLPGARLFYEGQFEGRKVRLPVFLARRPDEAADPDLRVFYQKLLDSIDAPAFRSGRWQLCTRTGWPDNSTFLNLVAWNWTDSTDRYLVVVNLSATASQALVQVPWPEGAGKTWRLTDLLSGATYDRSGSDMLAPGLYVDVLPWGYNLFRCTVNA